MTDPEPLYRVLLRAMPSDVPAWVRLKHALKLLRRVCALACVSVEEVSGEGAGAKNGQCSDDSPPG
jgi:hypothetical protein